MANYLLKYKGIYRILPEIDQSTNDFPREPDGSIDDSDIYIACRNNCKIVSCAFRESRKVVWLGAYIPSIGRGRNIVKELNEVGVEYDDYDETSEEVTFRFKAKDIDVVAKLMKARTNGKNISPFSKRNLPKPKSNIIIPPEQIKRYKEITGKINKGDLLIIHRFSIDFIYDIMQPTLRISDKNFNAKEELSRTRVSTKELIFKYGFFDEYLKYIEKKINEYYDGKEV